jgi:hypothetical protein
VSSHGEAGKRKDGDMDVTRSDKSNIDEEDQDDESSAESNTYAK